MTQISEPSNYYQFQKNVAIKLDDISYFNKAFPIELFLLFAISQKQPLFGIQGLNPRCIKALKHYNLLDDSGKMDEVTAYAISKYMSYDHYNRRITFI